MSKNNRTHGFGRAAFVIAAGLAATSLAAPASFAGEVTSLNFGTSLQNTSFGHQFDTTDFETNVEYVVSGNTAWDVVSCTSPNCSGWTMTSNGSGGVTVTPSVGAQDASATLEAWAISGGTSGSYSWGGTSFSSFSIQTPGGSAKPIVSSYSDPDSGDLSNAVPTVNGYLDVSFQSPQNYIEVVQDFNPGSLTTVNLSFPGKSPVPEPATIAIVALGLVGLAGARFRLRRG